MKTGGASKGTGNDAVKEKKKEISWFAVAASLVSIVTVTLALLGYGVSLAAENLFGIPHAAMFNSAFELIDLTSVAVLQIIPAIDQALSKWTFYVNLYRAQWPTIILAVAAVLLMAVGWYWPDLRSTLVKAYSGKKTNDLNGDRSAVKYWFMHALMMLFIFLSPLLALLGVVVIVLGLAILTMVPIMGMTTGFFALAADERTSGWYECRSLRQNRMIHADGSPPRTNAVYEPCCGLLLPLRLHSEHGLDACHVAGERSELGGAI